MAQTLPDTTPPGKDYGLAITLLLLLPLLPLPLLPTATITTRPLLPLPLTLHLKRKGLK